MCRCFPEDAARAADGAGGGIRTPDHLITNQALYRTELRQPDKEQIIALPVPEEQIVSSLSFAGTGPIPADEPHPIVVGDKPDHHSLTC